MLLDSGLIVMCIPIMVIFVLLRYSGERAWAKLSLRQNWSIDKEHARQFGEATMKALTHTLFMIFEFKVCWEENFFDTQYIWNAYPIPASDSMRLLYIIQLSVYFANVAALCIFETARRDFIVMLLHHVITSVLLIYSDYEQMQPIGLLVLLVHEPADICLYLAKAFGAANALTPALVCYVALVFVWFITRLWIYPFYLVYSVLTESWFAGMDNYMIYEVCHVYVSFSVLLISLTLFHVYWFRLICLVGLSKLQGKGFYDVREKSAIRHGAKQ